METALFRRDFESNSKLAVFWEVTSCGLVEFTNASEDLLPFLSSVLTMKTACSSEMLTTSTRLRRVTFQSRPLETQISHLSVSFLATSETTNTNKEIIILWYVMPWRWEERYRCFGTTHYLFQNLSSSTYHNTHTRHKTVILTLLAVGTINIINK